MFEGFKHHWFEQADTGGAGSATTTDANASQNGAGSANDKGGTQDVKPLVFDDWLKGQPEEVKTLLDTQTKGLKSALQSEREARSTAEKELRTMAGKAEAGSEAQKQLTQMADQMQEADRRAEFYDDAHRAGVTNLKLAYLSAVADERFDKRGRVNFDEMKKDYPELFGVKKPPEGNAGKGTGNNGPAGHADMNQWIRKAAGKG
jgi:hypothetical protein